MIEYTDAQLLNWLLTKLWQVDRDGEDVRARKTLARLRRAIQDDTFPFRASITRICREEAEEGRGPGAAPDAAEIPDVDALRTENARLRDDLRLAEESEADTRFAAIASSREAGVPAESEESVGDVIDGLCDALRKSRTGGDRCEVERDEAQSARDLMMADIGKAESEVDLLRADRDRLQQEVARTETRTEALLNYLMVRKPSWKTPGGTVMPERWELAVLCDSSDPSGRVHGMTHRTELVDSHDAAVKRLWRLAAMDLRNAELIDEHGEPREAAVRAAAGLDTPSHGDTP